MTYSITRREWLAVSGLALAFPLHASETGPLIRFGMVTDLHYADEDTRGTRFYRESILKLNECVTFMNRAEVDFLVELGDFKDENYPAMEEKTLRYLESIEAVYRLFDGPRYHVLGNHDLDSIDKPQFMERIENTQIDPSATYYSYTRNGIHFVVLDANFTSDGTPYAKGNFDWTDANIPPEELQWLKRDLLLHDMPTVVFCHQLLDGEGNVYINNAAEVREVLENAGTVMAVFNGHHHAGQHSLIHGIHYYTLRAVVEGSGPENSSYAIASVFPDGIEVTGYRRAESLSLPR